MTHRLHKIADVMLRHADSITAMAKIDGAMQQMTAKRDNLDDDGLCHLVAGRIPWSAVSLLGVIVDTVPSATSLPPPAPRPTPKATTRPKFGLLRGGKED